MRTTKTLCLAMAAGGAALLASRGDIAAGGAIDVTDATITIGDAPVPGTTTVDPAADLGNKPALTPPDWYYGTSAAQEPYSWLRSQFQERQFAHVGLGGTTFRAQVDLVYPGGSYDYGSFTVDPGVTVRFTGPATIRATNSMLIEGRIVMDGSGMLLVDCAGDVTIVGHAAAVPTGLFADDDGAEVVLFVGGALDVSADAGAKAHFSATGAAVYPPFAGSVSVLVDHDDPLTTTTIADAAFDASPEGVIYVNAEDGDLRLVNCSTTGPVAKVQASVSNGFDDAMHDALVVSGGAYQGAIFTSRWGVRIDDGAVVADGDDVTVLCNNGLIRILGGSSVTAVKGVGIEGQGVEIGEGCEVRTTGAVGSGSRLYIGAGYYYHGSLPSIVVGAGAVVEDHAGASLKLSSPFGISIAGTVRGHGASAELRARDGDVAIADGADVDAPNGVLRLIAGGAVTATGGTATLSAREYDVRCVTGDLDLDVATMDATAGRIVAMSNGPVRLRGTYRATGDVQVISLADSIDVHGATLSTNDAGAAPSGFVRMATYAATAIDAGESTLTTGDSQAQSGDVLIQTQDGGSAVSAATMRVSRVTARRTPDGVMTRIQGTISAAALRTTDLSGSARVTAGELSKRVYLQGLTGRIEGSSGTVTVKLTRVGKTQLRFTIEIREPTARAGEKPVLRLARAGFHAKGAFKRPKAR